MKSIEISIKEWFDKTYGNTYFAARITIEDEEKGKIYFLPFQYGDYLHAEDLAIRKILTIPEFSDFPKQSYYFDKHCKTNGYNYFAHHTQGNLKRVVKAWGEV